MMQHSPIHNVQRAMSILFFYIAITFSIIGQTAGAQTRFVVPDTMPDVSKYVSNEECLAALKRITSHEVKKLPYWIDTLELKGGEELEPIAASARDFSSRCLVKFNPDSVGLEDYRTWMRLYLSAGNDRAAQLIAKRKLDESSWDAKDSSKLLFDAIVGVWSEYSDARPRRYKLARSVMDFYIEGSDPPVSIEHKATLYSMRASLELVSGDTAAGKFWANKILSVIDSGSNLGKDSLFLKNKAPFLIADSRRMIEHNVLLDSLRISGHAYATFLRSIGKDLPDIGWGRRTKDRYDVMVNQKAKPLAGEFIYSSSGERQGSSVSLAGTASSSAVSCPTLGKVSLVVFLYGGCRKESPTSGTELERPGHTEESTMCMDGYTILRRIAKLYPEVDITIVSKTTGYLGELGPLTPQDEADSLRWLWLEKHKLPARLIVENTEYFRLPGLDRRRIDQPYENSMNYPFLKRNENAEIGNKSVYLIDSDGTILLFSTLGRAFEKDVKPMLDIITRRNKVVTDSLSCGLINISC